VEQVDNFFSTNLLFNEKVSLFVVALSSDCLKF